jgi:hypothetical protein
MTLPNSFSKWLYFTVVPALLPFGFLAAGLFIVDKPLRVETLFSRGELLLGCSAFAAVGLGDLIASGKKHYRYKLRAGGACLIISMTACFAYGLIGVHLPNKAVYADTLVTWFSIAWCVFSLLSGAACVILGQRR